MDCSRTSIRQGAKEVTLVYRRDMKDMPASNEVHEAIEEGVTAIFQAGPTRVITDKDNVTGVEFIRMALGAPDASGRRRPEPAPGTEFTIPCDRVLLAIGQGPELDLDRARLAAAPKATKNKRLQADAVTFETGRPGVFATGDVRIGAATVVAGDRRGPPRRLRGRCLPARQRPGRDPDPPDARRAGADLPLDRAVHGRGEGAALPDEGHGGRRAQHTATSSTRSRTRARRSSPSRRAASSARARRSASATCAASASSTARRSTTLEPRPAPGRGPPHRRTRTGSPASTTTTSATTRHAFILREPSRCIDCGRCAQVCSEVVGAACYDFMRIGFDTLVTTPLDMSLNDTPCVSCGRCAETCPTGALMPKPRVLQKYEVDESRCILCGICVDACPYDALRDGGEFELAHSSREEPMIDLMAIAAGRPRDRGHLHPQGARLAPAGDRRRPLRRVGPAADGPAGDAVAGTAWRTATATTAPTATGHGHGRRPGGSHAHLK